MNTSLDLSNIPKPVFDENPGFIELYYLAWQQAWEHVAHQDNMPQSPFMDEGLWDDSIWIWDTCFMALFCKYSPKLFPGVESLRNFYVTLHDGIKGPLPLNIQHPDNPPLFAWAEYDNFCLNGDNKHLNSLWGNQYLQKHFKWFENLTPGMILKSKTRDSIPVAIKKVKNGYLWKGPQSGMDNTPRYKDTNTLWLDALAQQGLSALYISRFAEHLGDVEQVEKWTSEYQSIKQQINEFYWDAEDGIYYDIDATTYEKKKVKTPASYWPMLAEMCSPEQAKKLAGHVRDSMTFGGEIPWPTVARDDPEFDAKKDGDYWRGGVWLPTAYMGIKALEKYDFFEVANESAYNLLNHMYKTYRDYSPHTIWECYSPVRCHPSENGGKRVQANFCGWSALGPISLFIENILGFHTINSNEKLVEWHLHNQSKHGIKNLHFGNIITDIIYDKNTVSVNSNHEYTLKINNQNYSVKKGNNTFYL